MKLSEPVLVALIAAAPPTVLSAAALITAWRGAEKTEEVAVQVEQVHVATNSMKDALVKATKEAALLTGHAQGVKDEKARVIKDEKR